MSEPGKSSLPHKVWRKEWKKMRRKKLRQISAQYRDFFAEQEEQRRLKDPSYVAWMQEQDDMEEFKEEEERRDAIIRHQQWLDREKQAQLEWKQRKVREEKERQTREAQEKEIQKEWEAMKEAEEKEKREKKEAEEREKERQEALLQSALSELSSSTSTHRPTVPSAEERTVETRPGLPVCPFFEKTGCCRFSSRCSRNHRHVLLSRCLLLEHFYLPPGASFIPEAEHQQDGQLEFEESECAAHFTDFYNDVVPEMRKIGQLLQFKVCQNYEPHLRGNVYIQYATENEAARAFRVFNGRWYGGMRISARFVDIPRWGRAICGSFFRGNCPKGRNCNFLHVYKNPTNEFWRADRDLSPVGEVSGVRQTSSRDERAWSERGAGERSSERVRRERDRHVGESGRRERGFSFRSERGSDRRSRTSSAEVKRRSADGGSDRRDRRKHRQSGRRAGHDDRKTRGSSRSPPSERRERSPSRNRSEHRKRRASSRGERSCSPERKDNQPERKTSRTRRSRRSNSWRRTRSRSRDRSVRNRQRLDRNEGRNRRKSSRSPESGTGHQGGAARMADENGARDTRKLEKGGGDGTKTSSPTSSSLGEAGSRDVREHVDNRDSAEVSSPEETGTATRAVDQRRGRESGDDCDSSPLMSEEESLAGDHVVALASPVYTKEV